MAFGISLMMVLPQLSAWPVWLWERSCLGCWWRCDPALYVLGRYCPGLVHGQFNYRAKAVCGFAFDAALLSIYLVYRKLAACGVALPGAVCGVALP